MSKYNPDNLTVRSVEQIREDLLSHPDNADRQDELDLLISWRLAQEDHYNEHGRKILDVFNQKMGEETSPSLRALSLVHELDGDDVAFKNAASDRCANPSSTTYAYSF